MIIVCVDWGYESAQIICVEHPDRAEALAILAMLPYGPEPVAIAAELLGGYEAKPLAEVVGGYLSDKELFDTLPIGILRAAVGTLKGSDVGSSKKWLAARELRDAEAADVAEMERWAAERRGAP